MQAFLTIAMNHPRALSPARESKARHAFAHASCSASSAVASSPTIQRAKRHAASRWTRTRASKAARASGLTLDGTRGIGDLFPEYCALPARPSRADNHRENRMGTIDRRDFLRMAGLGGVVFASGLPGCAGWGGAGAPADFHFIQLSDLHWGYNNASVNPDFKGTLPRAIDAVNALHQKPDFVVFTGDLTQTTDDPKVRRDRLKQVREMISKLNVPKVYY